MDARERFSATALNYRRYRPSYPGALLDWIATQARLSRGAAVADVGCGTGISTRLFAERGYEVTGIDPNQEMLEQARREPGAYLRGEACATGLSDASVDLVAAAQAYHWFDVPGSLAESGACCVPPAAASRSGTCAATFMEAYDALLRAHASEYDVLQRPRRTLAAIKARPEVGDVREAEFIHAQRLDERGLFGRAYSSSYVVHGLVDKDGFDRALSALFERHAVRGEVEFPYRCVATLWRIAPARE